ncbi:unnamed protein product, partial [Timema podura]|nr:unnamed protein product [Timema podura]
MHLSLDLPVIGTDTFVNVLTSAGHRQLISVQTCVPSKIDPYLVANSYINGIEKVKHRILRIFKIWGERGVYDEAFITDLTGLLSTATKKPTAEPAVEVEFQ